MGTWLQYTRIEKDAEPHLVDSAVSGKLKVNYRLQTPMRTINLLGYETVQEFHSLVEDVITPAIAGVVSSGFAESVMNKKSASALYDALSKYYSSKLKGTNPVTLFSGEIIKGRVEMEVYWLRVGKVFMLPAYQIFNNGLNTHLYVSSRALTGFPADTVGTRYQYVSSDWATVVSGYGVVPEAT